MPNGLLLFRVNHPSEGKVVMSSNPWLKLQTGGGGVGVTDGAGLGLAVGVGVGVVGIKLGLGVAVGVPGVGVGVGRATACQRRMEVLVPRAHPVPLGPA